MANLSALLRSLKKNLLHIKNHCYTVNRAADTAAHDLFFCTG